MKSSNANMSTGRHVVTLIVSYNSGADIEECIKSIPQRIGASIVVVDNDSANETKLILRKLLVDGQIEKLIENTENVGFAKAVNLGIRSLDDCDIFLMNPDASLEPGCLESLRSKSMSDSSMGLLTPVVYSDAGVRTMSAGMQPTIWRLFTHYSGLSRLFWRSSIFRGRYLFLDKHSNDDRFIEWAAGCCLYIPRRTIDRVGLLSEEWFMYGEDIEYCKRVLDSGMKILLDSNARAYHEMGVSVRASGGPVSVMWPRNTYDFYVKYYRPGFGRRLLWKSLFSAGLASRAILPVVRRPTSRAARVRAHRLLNFGKAVWFR